MHRLTTPHPANRPSPGTALPLHPLVASGRAMAGLVLCLLIAQGAAVLSRCSWARAHGLGALALAILLGIAVGNTVYSPVSRWAQEGVSLSKQTLLRAAVVGFGLRMSVQDLVHLGWPCVAIDVLVVASTMPLAWLLGRRCLGLDRQTSLLIAIGSSFCGAAAIVAAAPVVRARTDSVAVSVATVVIFGSLSVVVAPTVLHAAWAPLPAQAGPVFLGATLHEVAQVIAATQGMGEDAQAQALGTKMVRVMLLAPALLALAALIRREQEPQRANQVVDQAVDQVADQVLDQVVNQALNQGPNQAARPAMPWFALGFVLMVIAHSAVSLPQGLGQALTLADNLSMAAAMAALGLSTKLADLHKAGLRPLLLGLALWLWLWGAGTMLTQWIGTSAH